ncbi:MAG: hypothetical protein K0R54_4866 [Clostridiaceae bacterium]|jgi:nucleoside-triphosphatase THEP1|uniref:hypothetical protein n=1 Tax=Clostridium sp. TaxID=1506 RepID=UPI0025876209|nr:hypothetical protein [Clostridium sp.]MDF2504649.1 hypothetical protein [Clostridium sp.]MDF2884299.1 hypothetical protein [Clostridiaceae bacterium]
MKHRLIIVEGLPCSGKSSISKYIADYLKENDENICFVDEGTKNHPADYEFHGYLSKKELSSFSEEEQDRILKESTVENNGYIVPLSKMEERILKKLLQYKIYDSLPWDTEKNVMLNRWKQFVKDSDKSMTYIFNCCLLQNPMCETMIRFDYSYKVSKSYVKSICEVIKEMNPVIFYLRCNDINKRILQVSRERDKKWLDEVIEYHTKGAYGIRHELENFMVILLALKKGKKEKYR